jgi:hypothetical protein
MTTRRLVVEIERSLPSGEVSTTFLGRGMPPVADVAAGLSRFVRCDTPVQPPPAPLRWP